MDHNLLLALKHNAESVESQLCSAFSEKDEDFSVISDAQLYSLMAGGKRIRPFLVYEFCKLFGGSENSAHHFAAAIEMIHTFSLIHDDLPCMDNDTLRRGRNTCHVEFGEANALLAGDALSLAAIEEAAKAPLPSEYVLRAIALLSSASGWKGMIAGQIMDIAAESTPISYDKLKKLHSLKTGRLIECAALLGCIAAGVKEDSAEYKDAKRYASAIGLAFQIKDDILDATSDSETLGKTVGKDKESGKTTFLSFMDLNEAENAAKELTNEAISVISAYKNSKILTALAEYLLERKN